KLSPAPVCPARYRFWIAIEKRRLRWRSWSWTPKVIGTPKVPDVESEAPFSRAVKTAEGFDQFARVPPNSKEYGMACALGERTSSMRRKNLRKVANAVIHFPG